MEHGAEGEMLQAYQRGLKPPQPMGKPERSIRLTHTSKGGLAEGARINPWGKVGTHHQALQEEQRTGFARLEGPGPREEPPPMLRFDPFEEDHAVAEDRGSYYEQLVISFYEDNNPEKIDDGTVDLLLEKYRGKEHLLLKKITEKYAGEWTPSVHSSVAYAPAD